MSVDVYEDAGEKYMKVGIIGAGLRHPLMSAFL